MTRKGKSVPVPDQDLVKRAIQGDSQAVGELYLQHHDQIFKYLWSKVSDVRLAEDLTGEVFIRMVTRLSGFRDTGAPFQAWLYRIARNLVIDHARRNNKFQSVGLEDTRPRSSGHNPARVVEKRLTVERLQRALVQIDPTQAEVIRLRFLLGLPLKEVAGRMEKTTSAVKALQHRGLVALRARMK